MVDSDVGMATLSNALQPPNAYCPIAVTEEGMLTLASEVHRENASFKLTKP